MSATLYRADGTQQDVTPVNGKKFTLQEVYNLIGCQMLEIIDCGEPNMIMVGDEEARLHDDFAINQVATKIHRDGLGIVNPVEHMQKVLASYGDNAIYIGDPDEEPFTVAGDVLYMSSVMFD